MRLYFEGLLTSHWLQWGWSQLCSGWHFLVLLLLYQWAYFRQMFVKRYVVLCSSQSLKPNMVSSRSWCVEEGTKHVCQYKTIESVLLWKHSAHLILRVLWGVLCDLFPLPVLAVVTKQPLSPLYPPCLSSSLHKAPLWRSSLLFSSLSLSSGQENM